MDEREFYSQGTAFLERVFNQLDRASIALHHWSVDHLCYRVSTPERYQQLKQVFVQFAHCLGEAQVNGRPIATYKLDRPFQVRDKVIDLVELPAPKPTHPRKEGFEHLEVIADVPLEQLEKQYTHLKLNKSGLSKSFNQELEVELEYCAVKFHHLSLESIVQLEQQEKVYSALLQSQVLEKLKEFTPLIAGTFPLGIATENSDLDVLLYTQDLFSLEKIIEEQFQKNQGFRSYHEQKQELNSLIVEFAFQGVAFELFAQARPSVQQQAYRHFLVEEKLLKLGGEDFKDSVRACRKRGVKTEAAFAEVLHLSGDPYVELLKFQSLSDGEVLKYFQKT